MARLDSSPGRQPTPPVRGTARAPWYRVLVQWVDGDAAGREIDEARANRIDWPRAAPYLALHVVGLSVFWWGITWVAVATALGLYVVRMFAITGFYHRYFSHRTFKTGRVFQFAMALVGCSAGQRGPLWWAAHHRHHHRHADGPGDLHSPQRQGFWWSHTGWFLTPGNFATRWKLIQDWQRFPELRLLNRFDWIPLGLLAAGTFAWGYLLERTMPSLGTSGMEMLLGGFVLSTLVLYHATFTINSLAHCFGSRPFATTDESRNNLLLALITLGEGWHNNHHRYPGAARQGLTWWQLDPTYLGLRLLAALGLVWDLRPPPPRAVAAPQTANAASLPETSA